VRIFQNFITFQIGWFACVLGASTDKAWVGLVIAMIVVLFHLYSDDDPMAEVKLIFTAMLLGLILDGLLTSSNWLIYANQNGQSFVPPYWIIALWAIFATTINVTLKWMHSRYVIACIFGMIGGPLSFIAGKELGAVVFIQPTQALLALAIGWGIAMPLLIYCASHFGNTSSKLKNQMISNKGTL